MVAQRPILALALDAHRQGDLAQAAQLYQQITAASETPPDVAADAQHWLGVLHLQQNRPTDAIPHFEAALSLAPEHHAAHLNLGHAQRQSGDIEAALRAFAAAALSPAPDIAAAAQAALGNAYAALEQFEQSLRHFDIALTITPAHPALQEGRGIALAALGRYAEAEIAHRAALVQRPSHAGTHNNLGLAVKAQGRLDDAIWHFRDALRSDPNFVPALVNLGQSVGLGGDYDQASAPLQRAVDLAPDFAPAHHELANALAGMGQYEAAQRHYERAVNLLPASAQAWQNLGAMQFETGDSAAALLSLEKALSLNPSLALARFNRASILLEQGNERLLEGWQEYEARHLVWRSSRDWQGVPLWTGAASTDSDGSRDDNIAHRASASATQTLSGKTVLLYAEQGLGDTIQFVRFIGAVAAHAAKVIVEVPPTLQTIVARAATSRHENVEVIATGEQTTADIDYRCPLPSLPLALGLAGDQPHKTQAWRMPQGTWTPPYLRPVTPLNSSNTVEQRAPENLGAAARHSGLPSRIAAGIAARWRREPRRTGPFKVGIAWSGRRSDWGRHVFVDNAPVLDTSQEETHIAPDAAPIFDKRAIPLDALQPLFALPGYEWHLLQTEISDADRVLLAEWQQDYAIVDNTAAFSSFADTALAAAGLDHVVSIDTSLAHLAGAMGLTGTLMLPLAADWRWAAGTAGPVNGHTQACSAWYPSLKMLRQQDRRDWDELVQRVIRHLAATLPR